MSTHALHTHHGHVEFDPTQRAFAVGVALNLIFVAVELFFGFWANLLALLADAGHNFSDVIGLLIAWGALKLAAGSPTYQGGASNGIGYSLNAAWEYQFAPKLFAGGLLSIERSDFFAPNRAVLYLRYSFDRPGAQPVFLPPELVEPSSQF